MVDSKSPDELLDSILEHDGRYAREAYIFVSEALQYTVQKAGHAGHVSGRALCEGLCDFALSQFGRLARTVLESWGVRRSEDVGEIVFNMVGAGLLRKTDEDRREDFAGVVDFQEALDRGFELHLGSEETDEHGAET